jgi:hypothetical protein
MKQIAACASGFERCLHRRRGNREIKKAKRCLIDLEFARHRTPNAPKRSLFQLKPGYNRLTRWARITISCWASSRSSLRRKACQNEGSISSVMTSITAILSCSTSPPLFQRPGPARGRSWSPRRTCWSIPAGVLPASRAGRCPFSWAGGFVRGAMLAL